MPPKVKPDDFIEALLDSKVVDAFAKALAPFISLSIEESLKTKLTVFETSIRDLKTENARLNDKCVTVEKEYSNIKKLVDSQARRIDDLEIYSRSDNLIIRGLPEQSLAERATGATNLDDGNSLLNGYSSVETTVITFCRDALGVEIKQGDISIAHRLKAGIKDVTRPVIVRFANRRIRNLVYSSKKCLKGHTSRVFISEHLTKTSSDLFYEARRLLREKKIFGAWTQNGQVFVRFSPDPSTRGTLIRCAADLNLRQ